MNFFNRIHYAAKRIRRNFKMQLLSFIIMAVVLTMIYISQILLDGLEWGKKAVQKSLSVPVECCGIVDLPSNVDFFGTLTRFMERAYALEEIQAFGAYDCYAHSGMLSTGDTDYIGRLLEIQNSGEKEFADDDLSAIQTVELNRELFEMENIHLLEGELPDSKKADVGLVYLGYNFRGIPVGTQFAQEGFPNIKYEVAGIMEQGTQITDPKILEYNSNGLILSYNVKLDNMVLILLAEGEFYTVRNLFCVADGYTYQEAVDALEKLGREMGIKIRTGTVTARLDTVFEGNDVIRGRINGAVSISCQLLFMLCVTIQLLNTYSKRKELGVWLACGMSRREMLGILWLENFIKAVTGFVVAIIAAQFIVRILVYIYQEKRYHSVMREIVPLMYGKPLAGLLCAALLLTCTVSVIPVVITIKQQTAELVKGVWN